MTINLYQNYDFRYIYLDNTSTADFWAVFETDYTINVIIPSINIQARIDIGDTVKDGR
jgi:hypothetical protein